MISFEEAREIALPQIQIASVGGTPMTVADHGWEDETHYALIVEPMSGNREELPVDDVQTLITKRGGILQRVNALENLGRKWQEVGNWPELDDDEELLGR